LYSSAPPFFDGAFVTHSHNRSLQHPGSTYSKQRKVGKGLQVVGLAKDIVEKDWGVRDSILAKTALADRNK
jgi:hypothetical protein